MELKTKAIVMGSASKGESDKRVRLFSVDEGIIEATARGVKKQGAKLVACTFTFAFVEVVLAEKNGFFTVTGVDVIEPFAELSLDIEKYQLASSALEIVAEIERGNASHTEIFVELLNFFKLLCYGEDTDLRLCWCKWCVDMLALAGYKLDTTKCVVCGRLSADTNELFMDMESGSVTCELHRPMQGIISGITSDIFKVLSGFGKVSLADMNGRKLKSESSNSDSIFEFVKSLVQGILGFKMKSIF